VGFRAENREAILEQPTFSNPSGLSRFGSIVCPAGTSIEADLVPPFTNVDVDAYFC
jgi:hypothetical protein